MTNADTLLEGAPYFAFGEFQLFPGQRTLLRAGTVVPLGSRATSVLIALVEQAGELVTKNELMRRVWPDTFVIETNLTVHMASIRRALGDAPRGGRMIANEPSRGYRFLPPVAKLTSETPRPAPGRPAPATLPERESSLVGREADIATVMARLAGRSLLTIVGEGGVGKTALAHAVAQGSAGTFADGIAWIELAQVSDPALVPAAVAAAIGVGTGVRNPLDGLLSALHHRHMLLVLDNCEHVLEGCASLVESLGSHAAGLAMVGTSREPIGVPGETLFRIAPLDVPELDDADDHEALLRSPAVRLFVERLLSCLDAYLPGREDARRIAAICRRLDGLPLAIEFAAARVPTLGLAGVERALAERSHLLASPERGGPDRHRTIADAIAWSHALLGEDEHVLFQRLAVFASFFDLDAVVAACADAALPPVRAVAAIEALVEKSLLVAEPGALDVRYRFREITRSFAIARLAESGEEAVWRRRHALHVVALLEGGSGDAAVLPDLRAALSWVFSEPEETSLAVEMAVRANAVWIASSLFTECVAWNARALEAQPEAGLDDRAEMRLQSAFGFALMLGQGANGRALTSLTRAADLAEKLGDAEFRLRALAGLGNLRIRLEDFTGSLAVARRVEELASRSRDVMAMSMAGHMLSGPLGYMGRYAEAAGHARRALEIRSSAIQNVLRTGFDHKVACRCMLIHVDFVQGHVARAVEATHRLVVDVETGVSAASHCFALSWTGVPLLLRVGDLDGAGVALARLDTMARRHALGGHLACASGYRGALALRGGDFAQAERLLRRCLADLREYEFEVQYTPFLGILAETLLAMGAVTEAVVRAHEAVERAERHQAHWCRPELLYTLGRALVRQGPDTQVEAELRFLQAHRLAEEQGASYWTLRAAQALGELYGRIGRHDEGEVLLRDACEALAGVPAFPELEDARSRLDTRHG